MANSELEPLARTLFEQHRDWLRVFCVDALQLMIH